MSTPLTPTDRPDPDARAIAIAQWLAAMWFALLLLSIFALRLDGALPGGGRVSFDRAVFVATSVGTLTGYDTGFATLRDFAPSVRAVLLLQTCAGVLLAYLGGGVLLGRVLGANVTAALARWTLGLLAIAALLGGLLRGSESVFFGVWRGVATLGNLAALGRPGPSADDPTLWLVWFPLGIAGAVGPLAIALGGRERHVRRVLITAAAVFLIATAVFVLVLDASDNAIADDLRDAAAMTLGTHGFAANLRPLPDWPRGTEWPTLALIAFGVGTAGAVGGFGPAWLLTLPRFALRRVLPFVGTYALLIIVGLCVLARADATINGERLITLVVAAATNVGISHVPVSLTGPGLLVMSAIMVAGRLLPLIALSLMFRPRQSMNTEHESTRMKNTNVHE